MSSNNLFRLSIDVLRDPKVASSRRKINENLVNLFVILLTINVKNLAQVCCDNSHDPREGLWKVKFEKFCLKKMLTFIILKNKLIQT